MLNDNEPTTNIRAVDIIIVLHECYTAEEVGETTHYITYSDTILYCVLLF